MVTGVPRQLEPTDDPTEFYDLRLYVAGASPLSRSAVASVRQLCQERLAGRHRLEIVDIVQEPRRAVEDQVLAVPALVRTLPEPRRTLIGDLRDPERAQAALGLHGQSR